MSGGFSTLSEREKETLRLLLTGHDAKSIAVALSLSVHTVNERLREARRKLGVSSSREAARLLGDLERRDPDLYADKQLGVVRSADDTENTRQPDGRRAVGLPLAWLSGGMLVMSLIIAAVVLALAVQGGSGTKTDPSPEPVATSAGVGKLASAGVRSATSWIALVDGQRWQQSWREAGTLFKSQVTEAQWASTVQSVRQPLGRVSSRTPQMITAATSLPGAPTGEYEVIQFRTSFANKRDAVETITVVREASGWKVVGYFIR